MNEASEVNISVILTESPILCSSWINNWIQPTEFNTEVKLENTLNMVFEEVLLQLVKHICWLQYVIVLKFSSQFQFFYVLNGSPY